MWKKIVLAMAALVAGTAAVLLWQADGAGLRQLHVT